MYSVQISHFTVGDAGRQGPRPNTLHMVMMMMMMMVMVMIMMMMMMMRTMMMMTIVNVLMTIRYCKVMYYVIWCCVIL